MMQSPTTDPHLDDGEMVRLHDHELDHDVAERHRRHVDGCAACAERFSVFSQQSANVSRVLRQVMREDPPRTVTRSGRRYARVAGTIGAIAVVGGALAADPVRTWIADTFTAEPSPPAASPSIAAPAPPPIEAPSVMRVSFEWDGGPIAVNFTARQAAGTLTITWEPSNDVRTVIEDGGSERIAMIPGGVIITNASESTANYFVAVPASVDTVRVLVEGNAVMVPRPAEARVQLELGAVIRSSS